ncbi:hypothetical protein [Micromonospora okii]|uniref:hypothetical protein n=1 Tax=Micromonospora okii TaxID=1182970 RepID=UPI001E5AD991|nr:hypothetical protein [Micromonospora okii]
MPIARTRSRPRTARLLFGAALAAVLAFSTGGTATAAVESAGLAPARTDVFIKDIASDAGYEPHGSIYSSFFNSPDIKICPTAVECAASTNPVVGSTSYIFVKLRNNGPYGSGTSTGQLKVYYTTSGGGANWPAHWTPIGSTPSIPVTAGVTTTSIAWPNVPSIGHFCLLVRWESPTDPMLFEGTATSVNTQYNNNIAWKNANTVPAATPGPISVRPYALANALDVPARFDLAFRPLAEPVPGVKIVADLGPELFDRWRQAGGQGENIRVIDRSAVEILDPNKAQIRGILINPDERPVLKLSFSTSQVLQRPQTLQVVQVGPLQKEGERYDVGGVDYTFDPTKR